MENTRIVISKTIREHRGRDSFAQESNVRYGAHQYRMPIVTLRSVHYPKSTTSIERRLSPMRLPPFRELSSTPEYAREAYEYVLATRGSIPGPSGVLLRSPALGRAFSDLCGELRDGATVMDKGSIELIICLVGKETSNEVIWSSHRRHALKSGISEDVIFRLDRRIPPPDPQSDEAIILNFGRRILSGAALEDEDVRPALDRYGDRGLIELTAAVGSYLMADCVIRVAGLEPRV